MDDNNTPAGGAQEVQKTNLTGEIRQQILLFLLQGSKNGRLHWGIRSEYYQQYIADRQL